MPMVGMKEYAYTPKGMAMAKAAAKKTGKKMVVRKPTKKTTKKGK
jgi:aminoglycoside phosphotransferase (APT) family kinase protein